MPNHRLLIICGLSFAGKTTLGKAICQRFGYVEVDVDETKTQLFGLAIKDEELLPPDWERIYAAADEQIERLLHAGHSVVDASRNFSKAERRLAKGLAERAGVPLVTIYVDTPEGVARQRWLENRKNPRRRDVSESDFADILRAMQPPDAGENPIVFHYSNDIAAWLSAYAAQIAPGAG